MNARGAGFGGDKLCPHVVGSADVAKRVCGSPGLGEMEEKKSVWVDHWRIDWREQLQSDKTGGEGIRVAVSPVGQSSVSPAGGSVGGRE